MNLDHVVAKDARGAHAKCGNPFADVVVGLALQLIGVGCIAVVLTDKKHRQPGRTDVVHRLPECPFVRGAFAKPGNADSGKFLQLNSQRRADGDGSGPRQDRPAEETRIGVRDVLRTRLAAVRAGGLAVDLREQLAQRGVLGKVIPVGTVMAEQVILRAHQQGQRRGNGLLANAEVDGTTHLVRGMIFRGQRLLHPTQPQHLAQEFRDGVRLVPVKLHIPITP